MEFFREFKAIFAWSYEDLRGFDPNSTHHAFPIKEEEKQVRQRQRPINPALETTIRKEVEKLINDHIIFPITYYEWVSNIVPVQKKW
jgi:hypothetical protein